MCRRAASCRRKCRSSSSAQAKRAGTRSAPHHHHNADLGRNAPASRRAVEIAIGIVTGSDRSSAANVRRSNSNSSNNKRSHQASDHREANDVVVAAVPTV